MTPDPCPPPPRQPIVLDARGALRFQRNPIVAYLLDWCAQQNGLPGYEQVARPLGGRAPDLNELARMHFSDEDRRQLAQLSGYSLSGYGELPYVDERERRSVDLAGERVLQQERAAVDGPRRRELDLTEYDYVDVLLSASGPGAPVLQDEQGHGLHCGELLQRGDGSTVLRLRAPGVGLSEDARAALLDLRAALDEEPGPGGPVLRELLDVLGGEGDRG